MNLRSNKNLINSRLLRLSRKSTALNRVRQHLLYQRKTAQYVLSLTLENLTNVYYANCIPYLRSNISYCVLIFFKGNTLDLNTGYYHIELSAKSKELCNIVTQLGKYKYQRLPMGLCNSSDIFQENIFELFVGLDTVCVNIDNLMHVTKLSWTEHLTVLE